METERLPRPGLQLHLQNLCEFLMDMARQVTRVEPKVRIQRR
jgi:hypothetical protein